MEIFEQTLRDILIRTNLCGNRVFVARAPQKPNPQQVIPYIVFFMVAPLPMHTQQGPLAVITRDYQVSIFDTSQSRGFAIGDSLRTAIDTLRGDFEGYRIGVVLYQLQTWNYEPQTELFNVVQEYKILFTPLTGSARQPAPQPAALRR